MADEFPRDLGEDRLVSHLTEYLRQNASVLVGPGDDCAVVEGARSDQLQLLKTDTVVEGVHFESSQEPNRIGWKALARSLSDIAAMAGIPDYALVTLHIPDDCPVKRLEGIYEGMQRCAERFDVSIVGGETSFTRGPLSVTVAITGHVEPIACVLRSGGKAGDILLVTGVLGGSLGGHHLDFVPRLAHARWLTENIGISAMMDLSDGLAKDLPRMARASGCGYYLDENHLPVRGGCSVQQAMGDGEDYELLIAMSPAKAKKALERWPEAFPRTPLTAIGSLQEDSGGVDTSLVLAGGYEHFVSTDVDKPGS